MNLQEFTDSLSIDEQYKLAIKLTRLAVPVWDKYADEHGLTYRDTVVGLYHSVARKLLQNTIDVVEDYVVANKLRKFIDAKDQPLKLRILTLRRQFGDPRVALQDYDWELPDEVSKTFYAVYHLIDCLTGNGQTFFGESTIYLSINQAVDALITSNTLTFDEINRQLDEIGNSNTQPA